MKNSICINKSQRQTYKSVYVDIGLSEFSLGFTFVALSCCARFYRLSLNHSNFEE